MNILAVDIDLDSVTIEGQSVELPGTWREWITEIVVMEVQPAYWPYYGVWRTDDGVEAKTLAELKAKLGPGCTIKDHYPEGYTATHLSECWNRPGSVVQPRKGGRPLQRSTRAAKVPGVTQPAAIVGSHLAAPIVEKVKPRRGRPPGITVKTTPWTKDEHDTFERMWTAGANTREIGRVLGRSRNSVIGRLHRTKPKQSHAVTS